MVDARYIETNSDKVPTPKNIDHGDDQPAGIPKLDILETVWIARWELHR